MKSTRERILDYLENHSSVTAEELSHALHMTSANVRHHLAILLKMKFVEIIGERPPKERGRPSKVFSLSRERMGENLDLLAHALLQVAMQSREPAEQEKFLKNVARALIRGDPPRGSLTQRLFQTVRKLNEMNYRARWEAHAEAPCLILKHCPYQSILREHPELCEMDAHLLEEMLGVPVQQTARLARDPDGGRYCMFRIGHFTYSASPSNRTFYTTDI